MIKSSRVVNDIANARTRTLEYLQSLTYNDNGISVYRFSDAHDPVQWPGMLLPATYNAVHVATLLQGEIENPEALCRWFQRFRRDSGYYRPSGMTDAAVYKVFSKKATWQYIDFHTTNYTQGALDHLGYQFERGDLSYIEPFLDEQFLGHWLSLRDMRDPWMEGNNLVNLAGGLLLARPWYAEQVTKRLLQLRDWLDRHQEPATGFWGVGQEDTGQRSHALYGAMHTYHLYYHESWKLPYHQQAVEYCLTLNPQCTSACIDVDIVDLLVHAYRRSSYKRPEIEEYLLTLLPKLLSLQQDDGGFFDQKQGTVAFDGWVRGYREPQGKSSLFGTWFRWIAIAMIADLFWPTDRNYVFRKTIGIGYYDMRNHGEEIEFAA